MHGASPPGPGASGSESSAGLDALRRGHESGRARYGELGLSYDEYATGVLKLAAARRATLGLPPDPDGPAGSVASLALEDLYLARACDKGEERAWRALHSGFSPRLKGLAVARGVRGADADVVAADVLSDLALPAPRGAARTLIGTFGGSGSLWAWLAATLVRRASRIAPGEAAEPRDTAALSPPWREVVADETARRLDEALREAWSALEPSERVCLAWKHRHGLDQRRIAALLGVGEHQVSRWIARAVAKIRGVVDRCAGPVGDEAEGTTLWERLGDIVAAHLARLDAPPPPPPQRPSTAASERPAP